MHISHRPQVLCQQGYHLKQRQVSFLSQGDSVHGPHANQWRLSQTPLKLKQSKRWRLLKTKQHWRGTVSYLYKFVPILSGGMCPIYDLARPISEWMWDAVCKKAFAEMKRFLTLAPVLAYFDPSKSVMIQCDAGGQWLGATLLQDGQLLAYACRALSEAETIREKEMLRIIFSLEKWHQHTFGCPVTMYSDHKPLASIMKKPLDRAPKHLWGMSMRNAHPGFWYRSEIARW